MGELRLSDYSSDIVILSLLLLFLSSLAVPWVEVSVSSPGDALYFLLLPWVLVVPLHEGLHALTAKLLRARVRFGVTTINKFALTPYVAIETPLPAEKYVLVCLSPLALSAISISLAWVFRSDFWALVYIFNTVGMAGDFLTALVLLKMPRNAKVSDDGTVLRSDEEIPGPYPPWVSSLLKGLIVLVLLLVLLLGRVEVVVEK
ncbi:DUF3267 domain-containing protein [Thermococcus sp.]|uniref:DUF3267 domain-containing protein n=1 Tax=Thermococcus sp. TaxID=35749 RepID=UPI00262434BF|nr:DUF3267 domain-containing protein [Thermococcus sp.]